MRWSPPTSPRGATWDFTTLTQRDAEFLADLRAVVMRESLTHLGRFDETRVRRRFLDSFAPEHTWGIAEAGQLRGCIAERPGDSCFWIEHFYLDPAVQGRGMGTEVLHAALDAIGQQPTRLNVLQGSKARRLYERHGFTLEHEDPVDVFMARRVPDSG